jgi:hypothetical protein
MRFFIISIFVVISNSILVAQEFPCNTDKWEINARGYVNEFFEGKQALYLSQGFAELKDIEFYTGVLEYDVYVTERRGFAGIKFRIQDKANLEDFYIRPHQSGNPDANQYSPVFNGVSGWQLYYGEGFAAAVVYKMNEWNHVKLVVAETNAEVFINDMENPLLYIPELKRVPKSGGLGFSVGGPSPFHFADLKVTKMTNPTLKSQRKPILPPATGTVSQWQVSNSFPESAVDDHYQLDKKLKSGLNWKTMDVESKGYANLARVGVISSENNTVFAKVIIESEINQIKRMAYGYSDRSRIYLNDKILASGQNNYNSRDYRYLGTMGYFDEVYLELKKGKNELWIAVSESFGGWGIMAKFENLSGIVIK